MAAPRLHARWIIPVAVVVAAWVLWSNARATHWRELAPGLEFATMHGDPYCRQGSAAIAVLRLDPERVRLRVRHYSRTGSDRPLDVLEWQRRTGALAVFNAGQFYPDFRYMGLLSCGGRWVSRHAHAGYQALLVADRKGAGEGAAVLDIANGVGNPDSLGWNEVAQSFMLFDSTGTLRVRRSEHIANRTVVAVDRRRRVLVLVSEGAYTLADLAYVLQHSPLQLTHAMSMDGGREAELIVARGGFRYSTSGDWLAGQPPRQIGAPRMPLPAVITVEIP